ncbi:MAG: hypothetical protein RLZZ308_212 [Candidatus Parcubacteria bacterium]
MSEVIRFEVRLNLKQKLNSILEKLGYKKNLSFKEIFKEDISKKVVTHYWSTLIKEKNLSLFTVQTSNKDVLRSVYKNYPKIKPNRAIYLTGLFILAKDGNGMRELRSILDKKADTRTWFRITKDLKEFSSKVSKNLVRDWVRQIEVELQNYKALKIKDYDNQF